MCSNTLPEYYQAFRAPGRLITTGFWPCVAAKEPLTSENKDAESLDVIEPMEPGAENVTEGKRLNKLTARYQGFWRYRDDVDSENEEYS
jgi:hypothetical protein